MSRSVAQIVRIVVYIMLVVSAGAAFWLGDRLWAAARSGSLPFWAALLPVCAFTLFVVVYTLDRLILVKRRHYPTGRAFFQVVFAVLFLSLLWPHQATRMQQARDPTAPTDRAVRLLRHPEPDVRAVACELLGLRAQESAVERVAALAENDVSEDVRDACRKALDQLQTIGASIP